MINSARCYLKLGDLVGSSGFLFDLQTDVHLDKTVEEFKLPDRLVNRSRRCGRPLVDKFPAGKSSQIERLYQVRGFAGGDQFSHRETADRARLESPRTPTTREQETR